MKLGRDDILAAKDEQVEEVDVPQWKGSVFVRTMTGKEREEFEERMAKSSAKGRAYLVAFTLCDETGARLFADADIEALQAKNGAALDRIARRALVVNGLASAEELEGN